METSRLQKLARLAMLAVTLLFVSGFAECYKPVTKNQLPSRIKTVAVPAFQNNALRYKIEHRFTQAVLDELIHRGRGLRVQGDREGADAVIRSHRRDYQELSVHRRSARRQRPRQNIRSDDRRRDYRTGPDAKSCALR
jgi:hypothetical protein